MLLFAAFWSFFHIFLCILLILFVQLNEIKRKQAELQVEEDQLRKDQDELEEKKKQIGALIGQFSGLKA